MTEFEGMSGERVVVKTGFLGSAWWILAVAVPIAGVIAAIRVSEFHLSFWTTVLGIVLAVVLVSGGYAFFAFMLNARYIEMSRTGLLVKVGFDERRVAWSQLKAPPTRTHFGVNYYYRSLEGNDAGGFIVPESASMKIERFRLISVTS